MKSFATAVFDFLFTVKTANVEFFDTFGSKIQRSFFAYIHEEDLPKLQQLVEELPETHEVNHVVRIRDKNGEILLILLKLSLVHMGEEDLIEAYFIDILQTEANYNELVEKLQIKCSSSEQITRELSGGNQQKVCIARAIAMSPKVLFVCEPTRGVDIEAKEKVLELLLELNQRQNTTIVLVSSELQEMQRICDRIAILCEGRLSAVLSPDADEKDFALAYTGEMP